MEQIALIGDIHGNIPALMAAYTDIESRGIRRIWNLGDMCGGGPEGHKAVDWCRKHCEINLMGNWEDFFLFRADHPKAQKYIAKLGEERYAYLRTLPLSHQFWMSGRRIHLFHGRPLCKEILWSEDLPEIKREMFQILEDEHAPQIVGYADIHRQFKYDFQDEEKSLFNTGSIGNSFSGSYACYAILRGILDREAPDVFSIEFVTVPYDIDAAVAIAEEQSDWFDCEPYIKGLRSGSWQHIG